MGNIFFPKSMCDSDTELTVLSVDPGSMTDRQTDRMFYSPYKLQT